MKLKKTLTMILTALNTLFCVGTTMGVEPAGLAIFPGQGPGVFQGLDGSEFKTVDGVLQLRQTSPYTGKKPSMKARLKFSPALPVDQAVPGAVLVLKVRAVDSADAGRYNLLATIWQGAEKELFRNNLSFVDKVDWQELIIPLPEKPFPLLSLTLMFNEGNYDFSEISIRKPRRISVELSSDPLLALDGFTVKGTTDSAEAVWLGLKDADGKMQYRQVKPVDGIFSYTWDKPPLVPGRDNPLIARIGNGKDPGMVSIPLNVFGYLRNYDFAWLKAKGRQIVTVRDDKPFIPVGIGYARDVIIPAQDDAVMKFCKAHNLNTVRLAFYTRLFNGDAKRPIDIDSHIKKFIDPVVDAVRRNNMYVILDDHEYFHQRIDEANARGKQESKIWDETTVANWIRCWEKVATTYRDNPHVLGYELQNEPNGMSPEMVRDYYTRCIKAIRKIDTKHIILVGTNDWSHARAMEKTWGPVATTVDAPYNNIVFAFHDYPCDNHPWIVQQHVTAFQAKYNVPVMCTEFGATHWEHGETVCREFQAGMLALFAKEDIGWMIWALGSLKDNPRNPYNEIDKVGMNPSRNDSCSYSDLWSPVAKIMGTPFPSSQP